LRDILIKNGFQLKSLDKLKKINWSKKKGRLIKTAP
jgi:hypothetical protein